MYRKIIIILIPFLAFAQNKGFDGKVDYNDLCRDYLPKKNFLNHTRAHDAIDRILTVTGLAKRFIVVPCEGIDNCYADVTEDYMRLIIYDPIWMDQVINNDWGKTAVLAHEIGHHLNNHVLGQDINTSMHDYLKESRKMELEADEFAGSVLYKLGCPSLEEGQAFYLSLPRDEDDTYSTHPSRKKRLIAFENGWNKARNLDKNLNNYDEEESTLIDYKDNYIPQSLEFDAEDYFYKAYDYQGEGKYQLAIDNYFKAIDNNLGYPSIAYYNIGLAYDYMGDNQNAIRNYTRSIKLDSSNSDAYNNRGSVYEEVERWFEAKRDYSRAIDINPNNSLAYYNRGSLYLTYYSDNNRALQDLNKVIELDSEYASAYNNRGVAYENLGDNTNACNDYYQACFLENFSDDYVACNNYTILCEKDFNDNKDYVSFVQDGYFFDCPDFKILELIERTIDNPVWKSIVATDGNDYVNVTGYDGDGLYTFFQFRIDGEGFYIYAIGVDSNKNDSFDDNEWLEVNEQTYQYLCRMDNISFIQTGYFFNCPDFKILELIERMIPDSEWEAIVATDGNDYVNVTGYDGEGFYSLIQFRIDGTHFYIYAIGYDENKNGSFDDYEWIEVNDETYDWFCE